jgi:ABC-2 type transport system ATP-binding protein
VQPLAIETHDITRVFKTKPTASQPKGRTTALNGVTMDVRTGELFGLLGPNGAGKTTLIKILVTLLYPTAGRALVDGLDVVAQAQAVRERIAMVSGGETSGYGLLTVREQLWMFSQFYGVPSKIARPRAEELLKVVGLWEERDRKVHALSTGMRQRMNLCRGLITDPRILFLDEPTLGLDVSVARDIRAYIQRWVKEKPGRTILLTTHYMQEADELCERVAIIDQGKILICDSPAAIKRKSEQATYFQITSERLDDEDNTLHSLAGVLRCQSSQVESGTELRLTLQDDGAIAQVVAHLAGHGKRILSLQKVAPTLEDVFVEMVGRRFGDDEPAAA